MSKPVIAALAAAYCAAADLPPVIVEASRIDQSKDEIASHVDVITHEDIERSGAQNTVGLLEKRANLFIRKTNSNPTLSQVSMRGYGANGFGRVKVLVDGEELNNPDMSPQDLMRISPSSIRRIEILHGPQTVLHGGTASSGVINIITDSDSYEKETELEAHAGNLGAVAAHAGRRGGVEEKGLAYFANLDFDRSDGWRENSWYETYSAKGGLKQIFDDGSQWSLKTFYSSTQYGLPGGIYTGGEYGDWKAAARDAEDKESEADNDVYGINLSGTAVFDDDNSVKASASFRNRRSESYGYLDTEINSIDGKLQFASTAMVADFDNRIDLGIDTKYDIVDADAFNALSGFGGDNDFTRFSASVFGRDEFWFADSLSIFGGMRVERSLSEDKYDMKYVAGREKRAQNVTAAEAGIVWHPDDDIKLFARWTRFYHTPLADELFSAYGVPNMKLKPERGDNVEIGVDWTFLETFNFILTAFHSELKDEIMYLKSANCNLDDRTARSGAEVSFSWADEQLGSAGAMYTYIAPRFANGEYSGNDIPLAPRQQLRVYGEYRLTETTAFGGGYRFVGAQRYGSDYANVGGWLPSYGLFDLGLRFRPSGDDEGGFTFAFSVDNLFDKRYCDFGEYFGARYVYPASGRTFLFSLRYEF